MENTQNQQQLDPQAVNLAKAIRQTESGGDFSAKGASGEYGAYQFTQPTWDTYSKKYGVNATLEQSTPEQQNEVAYKQIKEWKDAGHNVGEVASMWNAGQNNPKAYLEEHRGTNKYGVKYDTPAYAKSVATAYQSIKGGRDVGIDKNNPSSIGNNYQQPQESQQQTQGSGELSISGTSKMNPTQVLSQEDKGQDHESVGSKIINWAFPILGDVSDIAQGNNKKTALQVAGDLGLSALWFIPGLGEAAKLGEGAGLISRALGSTVAKGAALGYGSGALSGLSKGKSIPEALSPNLETVGGAVTGGIAGKFIPKIAESLGKSFTQRGAIQAVEDNIGEIIRATKPGVRFLNASKNAGFKPEKLLASTMSIPDIVDGKFVTTDAVQNIQSRISQLGQVRAQALDTIGLQASLEDLRQQALSSVGKLGATGETGSMSKKINNIFDDFKNNYGDNLTMSQLEAIKEAQAGASGIYKRTGQIGEQNASSIIGDTARNAIEDFADQSGFSGMKDYNRYIAEHYNALDTLDKINGQTVKGGRLGNMMRGHTIGGMSAFAANATGGGFIGTMAAGMAGEGANSVLSKILGDTSISNPLRDIVLKKIESESPGIVEQLQKFVTKKTIEGGDVNKINKLLQTAKGGKIAPILKPKGKPSSVPGLITKGIIRTVN